MTWPKDQRYQIHYTRRSCLRPIWTSWRLPTWKRSQSFQIWKHLLQKTFFVEQKIRNSLPFAFSLLFLAFSHRIIFDHLRSGVQGLQEAVMSLSLPLRSAGSGASGGDGTVQLRGRESRESRESHPSPCLRCCSQRSTSQPDQNMKSLKIKTTLVRYLWYL